MSCKCLYLWLHRIATLLTWSRWIAGCIFWSVSLETELRSTPSWSNVTCCNGCIFSSAHFSLFGSLYATEDVMIQMDLMATHRSRSRNHVHETFAFQSSFFYLISMAINSCHPTKVRMSHTSTPAASPWYNRNMISTKSKVSPIPSENWNTNPTAHCHIEHSWLMTEQWTDVKMCACVEIEEMSWTHATTSTWSLRARRIQLIYINQNIPCTQASMATP